jgi:hypothetical protein
LGVFENTVLRRIFGFNREEVAEGWRRLRNEELHNSYTSPNIVKVVKSGMRWTEHITRMGEMRSMYKIVVVKPDWKRPLERPRRR